MKSKTTISRRHCPGEEYGISKSICIGRQKAHYPKCSKCEFKTGTVSVSTILTEEQDLGTLTAVKYAISGVTEKTRTKKSTGTKQSQTRSKVKETTKTIKRKKIGSIMVKSEPSYATIYLDGESIGITPAIIRQILPGTYEVNVKMEGYDNWKKTVKVASGKETSLNAILQGKNGLIIVESEPTNARIFVDSDYIGVTPAEICQVVPGKYAVDIKMDGYETWKKRVIVEANKKKTLSAILKGKNGAIAIKSDPTKAKIYLDDEDKGTTPVTLTDLKPGEYTVKIKLNEYETWENNVKVKPEKETFITAVLLKKYGSIFLESEPSNAKISLGGKVIDATPARLSTIANGIHLVEVIKEGYEVWRRNVKVEPGKEKSLTAALQLRTGSLTIESEPTKAMIYLDGKHVGTTPDSIESIVPGTHEIGVKLDGYDVWSERVNVEAGKENVLSVPLQINTGSVMIESDPAKSIIYFDGHKMGETPDIIISSSFGSHLVEVKKDGYDTWTKSVDIEPGKERTLSAILRAKTGSISINSQPSPAIIFINGKEVGNTPGTITDLIPDTYKIEVKKSGYEIWHESVEVVADKEKSLTASLRKTKGSISIVSKPPNAKIYLDGKEVGITPDTLRSVDIGLHEIEVRMKGYDVWHKAINIKQGKEKSLNAALQINTGSLSIKSDPGEAKLFINGEEHGTTPANITDIISGTCEVDVRLDGYAPWKKTVKIKPGKEISLIAALRIITGAINITSNPSAAEILIDGKNIGTTPKTINEIVPGKHLVEVSKDGYENWSNSVEIMPETEVGLTAELEMKPGSIIVNSKPSDAIVFLDEKEISTTPITITDLKPGAHKLEVKMEKYNHWSEAINIINGKELSITAELQMKTGSVNIKSKPSDTNVLLDEKDIGNTPIIITDLKPGKHKVKINIDGYEDWSKVVDIIPDKEVDLTAILQIKPGSACITSEPSGAKVFLENKNIGNTPVTITELPPGMHVIEVKTDGYEIWSNRVEIMPGKEIALTAELQVKKGSVSVKSEPSDGIVLLDENHAGNTPIVLTDLIPGKHKVEIKVEGYENWIESIDIMPEKEVALTAEPKMIPGTISMESKPAEAIVFLDEKEFGKTPITITDLQPGKYKVEVKMDGYEDWGETINIINGKVTSVTTELQILPGSVNIQSEPSDAIVLLDDIEAWKTPVTIADLAPGIHSVIVKVEGHENWSENIDIQPNEEYPLTASLRKLTGSISIKSNPPKAKICLDSEEIGTTPVTLKSIDIGQHEIEIMAEGYSTWIKAIDIKKGKNKKINVVLQKDTGSVIIKSEPSNAKVLIDGNEIGNTPVSLSDLKPGTHSVEIKMDGYESWSKSLEVIADKETVIATKLQIKTGTVHINSKPPNAKTIINGKVVGNTPITISDLKPDTYNAEIMIDGYVNWKESVDVIANKEVAIDAELQIKTGAVCVKSKPSNAMVLIDGNEIGNTPVTVSDLKPGMHSVEIKMDGYVDWSESLEAIHGKDTVVSAELLMETGTVSINSEPPNAKAIIDGKVVGNTPITIKDMKPDIYNLGIKMDGYVDWKESLDVKANKEVAIDAELRIITGAVCIKSDPSNAKVQIEGNEVGTTPVTLAELMPGTFNVEVMMDGYESWKESVNIISDKRISLTVSLQMKPGSVSIESKPSKAMVIINDQEVGTTPITIADLKAGAYNLELVMDGYEKWIEKVEIKSDEENSITALLQKITGSISIKSKPTKAIIYLEGKEVGTTPDIIGPIAVGSHEVEISIEGYKSWKKSINIDKGKNKDVNAVLQIINGTVSIMSEPEGAKIMLNGKEAGNTPVVIKDLEPGAYNVEAIMDGYNNWTESIDVIPGNEISLSATLEMKPGAVSIESEPTEATVLLDNKEAGTTPITITDLMPGIHNLEVKMKGYEKWNEEVNIIPNEENAFTAVLRKFTGSISIKSNPKNAKLYINGQEIGITPNTLNSIDIGPHEVEVVSKGYKSWKKSINIKKGKRSNINAVLQINTANITIKSEPSDAKVLIDGNEVGNTPITITDHKPGVCNVEVKKSGYDDWKESIDIIPEKDIVLSPELRMNVGSIIIESEPTDALVLIDDKEVGNTPITMTDLKSGIHFVAVRKDGYANWNNNVNIVPDEEITLAAELQLKTGAVSIKSEPSNARTMVDGKEVGTTPITITDLESGIHNIEVSLAGFENWSEKLDIKSDIENSITATLHKITGSTFIKSKPPNAKIYLDGEEVGTTPASLSSVAIGPHEIEIETEGYTSWKSTININKGKNKKINVVLQKSTGSLCIKSNPSNADVLIDGNEIGITPVTKTDLKLGTHNVEVIKDGYEDWGEIAEIIPGKEITLKPVLQMKAGSISMMSKPSGALIFMNGKNEGTTPNSITDLKPGIHHVEARMDGYYDWRESVEIIPGKEMELSAVLKYTIGSLNIKSNPTDAEVFIDDKKIGVTPKTITDLHHGTHNVEVRKIGYESWSESVNILPDKEIHLTAMLQLGVGSISLKSDPSNARALIDGGEVGTTPISITDLKPGTHYLEIRKDGYVDWRESLDIIPGKELPFVISLQIKAGTISIKSNPSNAKAFIDGKEAGTTPITKTDIEPGTYNVEVLKDGYVDWKESVDIAPGKDIELTATLQIMPGSISIKSNPSGATVFIDGREIGITPVSASELTPGMHNVDVRMDGYEDWKESIDIIPNKEVKLTPTLQVKFGSVSIDSDPPNAIILMNGKEVGPTPSSVSELLPGKHKVEIIKEGYLDWVKDIDIIPDKEITLSATLQIKAVTISIKSEPSDAKAFIDGKVAGTTPLTITTLKPGTHKLEVMLAGHENWKENIVVESDKENSIVALLKKTTGSISIKSKPLEAKIYLDGEDVGTTPTILNAIPVGTHELEIKIGGYEEWKRSIIVKEGKVKSVNATLQLNVGSIIIESYPAKANIILDGKEVGKAPKRLTDIIVGTHAVEVCMDGHDTWKKTINIKAGKEISLTADLKETSNTIEINTDRTMDVSEISKPIIDESREVKPKPEKEELKSKTIPQKAKPSSSKSNKKSKYQPDELITLRSTYGKFSDSQINTLQKISIRETNNSIFFCHSNINHGFELKPIADGEVVIDHATELMWYQSGSNEYFNLKKAIKWIKMANKKSYASFNDWRLPTLEEASSLLEHEMKDGYFIDSVFDKRQWGTWTGDKNGRSNAWIVVFVNGTVSQTPVKSAATFVRPVRSFKK